ncbi:cytosolic carboxypeptidase 6-like isoform X1 [Brachyhypopomus gauderio]|uniref:cytosolic carboxypeptidase 6-like isoform X1 n=1 Tax=Brachyhypopomus gauderio TaxID=698409 RepID=UPI00404103E8
MEERVRDLDTGSEAGDDALVGNVSKLTVTPPGHTGAPRKGHLTFDACFESGNLGRVDYISEFEFDLFIRPDTCNPRFRVWFNFTVEHVRETQTLSLALASDGVPSSVGQSRFSGPAVPGRPAGCRSLSGCAKTSLVGTGSWSCAHSHQTHLCLDASARLQH